jgi:hypothetical protein
MPNDTIRLLGLRGVEVILRDLLDLHGTDPSREQIGRPLIRFYENAASEGINRLIKTDARCAFGYRNPGTQRLRARCATTRRVRGCLPTRTSRRHGQPRRRD